MVTTALSKAAGAALLLPCRRYRSRPGLLGLLGWLLVAGCQPRDDQATGTTHLLLQTGFEQPAASPPEMKPLFTPDTVHTGKYAVRMGGPYPSALVLRAALGSLCTHRPRRLTVSAWVWVPGSWDNAALQVAIATPGEAEPVLRAPLYVADDWVFRAWHRISQDINLPSNISSQSQLTISLDGAGTPAPIYVDDLRVTELW